MEAYVAWRIGFSSRQHQSSEVESNEGKEAVGSQGLLVCFLFLILPLAHDCYRFSVPGLKYSGWKLFPSLFDAKNTGSTFSLSKSCYFCSVFVSSEKPESQSFEARVREFKSQLYHFLLSDLGQVITHSVLCFLNCKIRMIIIVPPSWASMKVKLVVEHSLRAM